MRNLFFKVFALILFSSVALFAAASVFFYFIYDHDDFFDPGYAAITELAHDAIEAWREHGEDGLAQEAGELRRHGIRIFLMHDNGRAIGRPPPRALRARITHYPQTLTLRENSRRGTLTVRAVSVADAGQRFHFIFAGREHVWRGFFAGWRARILWPLPVIALASLLISLLITRPLGGLKTAAQNFAGGNLTARAPKKITRRNDAFGELAREFDAMSARIEKLVAGQRRLLRDVSHELRSPLSRMLVAATLLEDKSEGGARAEVERIQTEIGRLDALIAQLLSLAKLQSDEPHLKPRDIDLTELLRRVARDASYEFAGQDKRIEVHGETLNLRADADTLQSAFENVIRNGLRHAKSEVHVHVRRDGEHAEVRIRDDGAGVAETELRNIFDAFHRPDAARADATGGAGIGLAIAKAAVEAHRGSIGAKNAGGGLTVTLRLPL